MAMKKVVKSNQSNNMSHKGIIRDKKNCPCHRGIPAGCEACGNPDYPACKNGCPMFDD